MFLVTTPVKILFINATANGLTTSRMDIADSNDPTIATTILAKLNVLGKSAHALVQRGNKYFVVDHTARKGASKIYFEHETKYHPHMGELS